MRTTTILFIALSLTACGKKDSDKDKGGAGGAAPAAAIGEVNAAVPKELAGKLEFEAATGEKNRYTLVAPKGWKTGMMPGSYEPPEGSGLGFMTRYSVSDNCDGDCAPKDWAATADKVEFAQLAGGGFTIEKDEKADGSRLVVARNSDGTAVVVGAWWKEGASRYVSCRARLDKEAVPALAAFEKACRQVRVSSWD